MRITQLSADIQFGMQIHWYLTVVGKFSRTQWWVMGLLIPFVILAVWSYQQQTHKNAIQAVHIGEGLKVAGLFKTVLSEYYLTYEKLPASNSDVRLNAPEAYGSNALRSVEITLNGDIKLTYDDQIGVDDGVIRLIPDAVIGMITWRCETADFPAVNQYFPQCQYRPKLDTNIVVSEPIEQNADGDKTASINAGDK